MLIDSLAQLVRRSGCVQAFWDKLDAGNDATLGVAASARPFMVAARFTQAPQPTLVVVAGEDAAQNFYRSLVSYLGEDQVIFFPKRSEKLFASTSADKRQIARRAQCMEALARGRSKVVVAPVAALLHKLPKPAERAFYPLRLAAGAELGSLEDSVCLPENGERSSKDSVRSPEDKVRSFEDDMRSPSDFEGLLTCLVAMGYERLEALDGPGTFAVRGGLVDVYPGNLSFPVRLDFFGDELDEIRRILPATGQSISSLSQVDIFPVCEYSCDRVRLARAKKRMQPLARTNKTYRELLEQLEVAGGTPCTGFDLLLSFVHPDPVCLGSYVPHDGMLALIEPRALFDDATHAWAAAKEAFADTQLSPETLFVPPAQLDFGEAVRANYLSIMTAGGKLDVELPIKRTEVAGHPDKLFGRLKSLVAGNYAVVLSVPNPRARVDLKFELVDRGIPFVEELGASLPRGIVVLVDTDIALGMIIPKAKLAIVSIADTRGSMSHPSRRVDITDVTFPFAPGDYVVHAAHGVAFFKELVQREIDGVKREYLHLQYAEGDKLYVPVDQLDRVTRYVGPEGAAPRLTRLNTSDWSRALVRARKATRKLAFDLVDIYTRRAAVQGFRFGADTPWQREMEDAFPYEETPDQLRAIADVKADMESARPMDRLVCGDVGFGKTEVALRAAFKACQDNKQVMVLCPTTILAQQHYQSFHARFEPFGVRVDVLSRFRSAAQQKETLEAFAQGKVNVLIGTHRLLSRDVNPQDLGLVVIDEEQRFGVGHKEQLKNLRESVDVLTLSATPIPRTMQMSLSGVRDMSLILTPPRDRRPVKVHVGQWDPDVVSAAIRFELDRRGQVYYVSNRVKSIDDALARVQEAAGEARVGCAHGQMSKDALERVMEDFVAGNLDVLVATTIIESGIDNPRTNTLIIEDAQRLGLAQMYQLKGRVGRSATQAYAYFMFPEQVNLTEEALARLTALNEYQDLGSGMRIAMRDLEIRGAGNLLGAEQSGNMSAVGFDLFAQMLSAAVTAAREGDVHAGTTELQVLSDIVVNVPGHAYLAQEYIADTDERVLWYRRLASAATRASVADIEAALLAAHPDPPAATRNLISKARLRAFANEQHIKLISTVAGKLVVEPIDVSRETMSGLRKSGGRYRPETRKFQLPLRHFEGVTDDNLLETIREFLERVTGDLGADDAGSGGVSPGDAGSGDLGSGDANPENTPQTRGQAAGSRTKHSLK